MAKNLKAFVRYTGDGYIVPGGNILARKKPTVGRWNEITANVCCAPSTHTICVSGFEFFTNLNGTYTYVELADGKPKYQKAGPYDVYWNTDTWYIGDWATSTEDVAFPYLVTSWTPTNELETGTISVVSGSCTTSTTTTVAPDTCSTYRVVIVRGTATLSYTDCYGVESGDIELTAPVDTTFCALSGSVRYGGDGEVVLVSECTTTTTTTTSTSTTTTTSTSTSTTTTTTTTAAP